MSDARTNPAPVSDMVELLRRVEAATGPDRKLDRALAALFGADVTQVGTNTIHRIGAYTASIDAALALVERMLPGWYWRIDRPLSGPSAELAEFADGPQPSSLKRAFMADAPTVPLAILVALLKALTK